MEPENNLILIDTKATEEDETGENKIWNELILYLKNTPFQIDENEEKNEKYFGKSKKKLQNKDPE